jgi:hypothetical protein
MINGFVLNKKFLILQTLNKSDLRGHKESL